MITRTLAILQYAGLFVVCLALSVQCLGQGQHKQLRQGKAAEVEHSLSPFVPVKGVQDYALMERMRHFRVPGLQLAVVNGYKLEYVKSYGLADTTTKRPVIDETLFSAGSISKMITAMAAMKLVEQGKLTLDAPINKYLKAWKLAENELYKKNPPTLKMLLSHTGGTSQSAYWGFTPADAPFPTPLEVVSGAKNAGSREVGMVEEAGMKFNYSGGGYMVVQQAMCDATGEGFAALCSQLLFTPLHLTHTTFEQPLPARFASKASNAYSDNAWFKGVPYVYPQQAPAGLYSTAGDLALLLIELQNALRGQGKVLSKASARAMVAPQAVVSEGTIREQIGLGPFLFERGDNKNPNAKYLEHTGVNAGFIAYLIGTVETGQGCVVMMNQNNGAADLGKEVRRAVAKAYQWPGFLLDELAPKSVPDTLLTGMVGRYQRGPDEVVEFVKEGQRLVERINGGEPIYCYPLGGDTIGFTDFPMRGYFKRNGSGRIDSFRVEWQSSYCPRLPKGNFLANELLRAGRYEEAMVAYASLNLDESTITYLAYELTGRKYKPDLAGAEAILDVAHKQFPNSAIVWKRIAELALKQGKNGKAIEAYTSLLRLNPEEKDALDAMKQLKL